MIGNKLCPDCWANSEDDPFPVGAELALCLEHATAEEMELEAELPDGPEIFPVNDEYR